MEIKAKNDIINPLLIKRAKLIRAFNSYNEEYDKTKDKNKLKEIVTRMNEITSLCNPITKDLKDYYTLLSLAKKETDNNKKKDIISKIKLFEDYLVKKYNIVLSDSKNSSAEKPSATPATPTTPAEASKATTGKKVVSAFYKAREAYDTTRESIRNFNDKALGVISGAGCIATGFVALTALSTMFTNCAAGNNVIDSALGVATSAIIAGGSGYLSILFGSFADGKLEIREKIEDFINKKKEEPEKKGMSR